MLSTVQIRTVYRTNAGIRVVDALGRRSECSGDDGDRGSARAVTNGEMGLGAGESSLSRPYGLSPTTAPD
jgi:hypothetical protein